MSRSPRRIAALMGGRCRDAGAGHSACRERGSGGGDRAAVLSAEVDPGAVRATRKNLPFPSRFGMITKIQHAGSRKYNTSRRHLYLARLMSKVMKRGCCG